MEIETIYVFLFMSLVILGPWYIGLSKPGKKIFKNGVAFFVAWFAGIASTLPIRATFGAFNLYSVIAWAFVFLGFYLLCSIFPRPNQTVGMDHD
ncbi:hypothetical protein KAR26_01110 [Candidatus Parcubacteria bacterium]|nr:hypothetical protein [Candidatus Parcubacteria bacterium]